MSNPALRAALPRDIDFLWEMLVAAAAWDRPDSPYNSAEVRRIPDYARYVDDWGRETDLGLVAEIDGTPVGATWMRFYELDAPAFGFVRPDVPELVVGVRESHRGQGLGGLLLASILDEARNAGIATVSLSVEKVNPAVRLYQRLGFEVARDDPAALVMTIDLPG